MNLRDRLLALFRAPDYVPLAEPEIARALGLARKERDALAFEIRQLLAAGEIVRIKQDQLCLPRDADLVTGRIQFRQGGSAYVIPETRARANPRRRRCRFPPRTPASPSTATASSCASATSSAGRAAAATAASRPAASSASSSAPTRPSPATCSARNSSSTSSRTTRASSTTSTCPIRPSPGVRPVPAVGDKVVVKLHEWKQRHVNPEGDDRRPPRPHARAARRTGRDLPQVPPFDPTSPTDVLREAAALPARVGLAELFGRLDYRDRAHLHHRSRRRQGFRRRAVRRNAAERRRARRRPHRRRQQLREARHRARPRGAAPRQFHLSRRHRRPDAAARSSPTACAASSRARTA